MFVRLIIALLALLMLGAAWFIFLGMQTNEQILRLGSTTSTKDSGLLDAILPLYEAQSGVSVVVFAKGTGAAIRDGRAGLVDALLVHNQSREEALVLEGIAQSRRAIMNNDFLFVGPKTDDYLHLSNLLTDLAQGRHDLFLTRGDDSGTHAAELALWATHGHTPETFGVWYQKTGTGMGQTLITANSTGAITLVDSATWARHGDVDALRPWVQSGIRGNDDLLNPYGYLVLNPDMVPGVAANLAEDFGAWLAGPDGQAAIAAYQINGVQAFRPNPGN